MKILALESSCDDLAVCVFEGPDQILVHQVASQEKLHAKYGGIVPEVASREHLLSISTLVKHTLESLPEEERHLDGVAVTCKPGLVGSLLVGLNFAKGFALSKNIPLIGVNHLEGHLMSAFLEEKKPTFPFTALVISGGHTNLYDVEDFGKYRLIGMTVDDAVGEAYDKAAKILGLGYPGGPILDRLAKSGDPKGFRFSMPRVIKGKYFTSFSGLKTAFLEYVKSERLESILKEKPIDECQPALDLIASFQKTVVRILERLLLQSLEDFDRRCWVLAGGVACNSEIRTRLSEVAHENRVDLCIPRPLFCTDNAAMIAYVGHGYLERGVHSDFSLNATATAHSSF